MQKIVVLLLQILWEGTTSKIWKSDPAFQHLKTFVLNWRHTGYQHNHLVDCWAFFKSRKINDFLPLAGSRDPGLGSSCAAQRMTSEDLAFTSHPHLSLTCVNVDTKEKEKVVFFSRDTSTNLHIPERVREDLLVSPLLALRGQNYLAPYKKRGADAHAALCLEDTGRLEVVAY